MRLRPACLLVILLLMMVLFAINQLDNNYRSRAILQFTPTLSAPALSTRQIDYYLKQLRQFSEFEVRRINNSYLIEVRSEGKRPDLLSQQLSEDLNRYIHVYTKPLNSQVASSSTLTNPWLSDKIAQLNRVIPLLRLNSTRLTKLIAANQQLPTNLALWQENQHRLQTLQRQRSQIQQLYQHQASPRQRYDLSWYQPPSTPILINYERYFLLFMIAAVCTLCYGSYKLYRRHFHHKLTTVGDIQRNLQLPVLAMSFSKNTLDEWQWQRLQHYTNSYFQQAFLLNRQLNNKQIITLAPMTTADSNRATVWQLFTALRHSKRILLIDCDAPHDAAICDSHIDWSRSTIDLQCHPEHQLVQQQLANSGSLADQGKIYHSHYLNIDIMPLAQDWLLYCDPAALQQLRSHLLKLQRHYQLIVFIPSPLSHSPTAQRCGQISDANLLLLNASQQPRHIRQYITNLRDNAVYPDGIILTQTKVSKAISSQLQLTTT